MIDRSVSIAIDTIIRENGGKFFSRVHKMKLGQIYIPPNSKNICVEGQEFTFPTRQQMEAAATALLDDKRTKNQMYLIG
jgi:hypothetical protein